MFCALMSIEDDLQSQPSITEGDRASTLFPDRLSFRRLLAKRLHWVPKTNHNQTLIARMAYPIAYALG